MDKKALFQLDAEDRWEILKYREEICEDKLHFQP